MRGLDLSYDIRWREHNGRGSGVSEEAALLTIYIVNSYEDLKLMKVEVVHRYLKGIGVGVPKLNGPRCRN